MNMTMQTKEIVEFKRQPALLQLTQEWRDNEPFLDKLNLSRLVAHVPMLEQAYDQLAHAAQQRCVN